MFRNQRSSNKSANLGARYIIPERRMLMAEFSERKNQVLASVVELYIKTGEPVGSKGLLAATGMNCSSATVRNEMNELD
jgi:hypothetical protein